MNLNENESNIKFIPKSYSFLDGQNKINYQYNEKSKNTQNSTFNFEEKTNNYFFSNFLFEKNRILQEKTANQTNLDKPINFNDDIFNFKRNKSLAILSQKNSKIPNNIEYYIDENGNPNSFKNYNQLFQKKPIAYIITNNSGNNYLVDLNGEKINSNNDGDFYFPGRPFLLIKNFDVQNPELRVFGEGRHSSINIEKINYKNKINIDNTINDDDISFKNLTQPKITYDISNTIITNDNSNYLNKQKNLLFSSISIANSNNKNNNISDNKHKKYYSLINSGRNSNFMEQYLGKINSANNNYQLKDKINQKYNILSSNDRFQINLKNNNTENIFPENLNNEKSFNDDDSFHHKKEKNKKNISISSTCSTNKYKSNNNYQKLNSVGNVNSFNSLNIYDIYYKKNCIDVRCKIKNKKINTHNNGNKLIFNYERKNKNPIIINPLMKKEITDNNCDNKKNSNDSIDNESIFSLEKEKQKYYTKVNTNRKIVNSILRSINQANIKENKNESKFIRNKRVNKYVLIDNNGINRNKGNCNYYKKPQKVNKINTITKLLTANNNDLKKTPIIKKRGVRNRSMSNIYNSYKIHNIIKNKSETNFTPIKNKYNEENEYEKLKIVTNITKCPHCHYIFTQPQQIN